MAENNEQPQRRISRGRQKVAMVKMANESNLQVTFSKRRTGVFKKASELCTLCGIEMALVIFSPGKKVFSFGHPSVETILNRYGGAPENPPISGSDSPALLFIEAHRNMINLRDLNSQLAQVTAQVDAERKRGDELNQQRRDAVAAQRWWEAPVEKIDNEGQLRQLSRALDELRRSVSIQTDRTIIQTEAAANATTVVMDTPAPFCVNGGGGRGCRSSGGQVVFYNNMNNGASGSFNNNKLGSYGRGFF